MFVASNVSRFVPAFLCLAALQPGSALAGAFLLEPGRWQVISSMRVSSSTAKYDAQGRRVPEARYAKTETATLIEYGYDRDVTVLMQPSVRHLRSQGPPERQAWNVGAMDFGARWRIRSFDASTLSFQALFRLPLRSDPEFLSENRARTEMRLGYGRSDLTFRGRDAFTDASLAWIKRSDIWRDEVRYDLTLGWQQRPRRMVLLQWFHTWYPGAPGESRMPRQLKVEASTVSKLGDDWSLQMGSFVSRGGVSTRFERGSIIGLWRRF